MKQITILITIILIILELNTNKYIWLGNNIWYIDIFSHFKAHIIFLTLFVSFLIWIYIKLKKINILIYKKISLLFINNINIFLSIILLLIYVFPNVNIINLNYMNNKENNLLYYQNIEGIKEDYKIKEIYKYIKKYNVEYIWVVENTYEFNDFLELHKWNRISWNKKTECSIYSKQKWHAYESKIINTKSWYKICYAKINNIEYYLVHPHPPINKNQFTKWNLFIDELFILKKNLQKSKHKFIFIWDFNDTIFNSKFNSKFNDIYKKNYYSRHTHWFLWIFLKLPIDQVLSNLKNIIFFPLIYNYSDHRPYILKNTNYE